ncbi:hypothetical protein PSU51_19990 [Yersinia pestis]|nr:hypothetical protein [Yersinia pestis]
MDHLKMTPIGSLSNFKSIGHRLTAHQTATSSSRQKASLQVIGPQTASKLKQKPMVGLIYCSGGFTPNFRSFRHRLTQFQLLTENRQLCATKSSAFSGNWKLCKIKCKDSHQVSYKEIRPINGQNVKEKYRRKKNRKTAKTDTKRDKKGENPPRVADPCDPGARGRREGPGNPGFRRFFAIRGAQPLVLSKIHAFETPSPLTSVQNTGKSSRVSKTVLIATRSTKKKCAFHPTDREIDRTDGTDPLLATNT